MKQDKHPPVVFTSCLGVFELWVESWRSYTGSVQTFIKSFERYSVYNSGVEAVIKQLWF